MSTDFFRSLKSHSEAKLVILEKYIDPWMRKIVLGAKKNGRDDRCLLIDGFAGAGVYKEEGLEVKGSPLRIIDKAIGFCDQARSKGWEDPGILIYLNEYELEVKNSLNDSLNKYYALNITNEKEFFSVPNYESVKVCLSNNTFDNFLTDILDNIDDQQLIPTFCFIDPFGFSQTPIDTIGRLLKDHRSEVLVNFMYEEINRFLTVENLKIQNHLHKHFGVENMTELHDMITDKKSDLRKSVIIDFYSRQLNQYADFILNFEFKKERNITKMFLFFASSHYQGLKLMKDQMWKLDNTGQYLFKPAHSTEQMHFEFIEEIDLKEHREKLGRLIFENFRFRSNITEDMVEHYIVEETSYPAAFLKKTLKDMEEKGMIREVKKIDGTKRTRGFSKVLIHFY
ncbi:three-Cys-motif partner protein TcmP [Geomicrobium sediminis]|uniref:Three-Cys-motif partner protein n=1 Tax=Geomicrobium sediminis TaxID=1347788 RepID=A0ABS2PFX1_9BACL|nr:three-Cys-motif partner protein TcmP [Geomicrobium sediminis]MBM7633876.1 three-Cys-motif partner protein [Geomicrobium sediminis]